MKMKDFKNATKKQKLILLGAAASLGIIILGIGLGVGLSNGDDPVNPNPVIPNKDNGGDTPDPDPNTGGGTDTGGENPDPNTGGGGTTTNPDPNTGGGTTTTPTTPITEGVNWKVVEEVDSSDTSKQIKILKISDNIIGEEDLTEINKKLTSKGIDVTTINEIHFPFRLKPFLEEDKIRELLKMENLTNDNIGYVLEKNGYQDALAGTQYQNQKLVELNLPEAIKEIPDNAFKNNRISKVNWDELINLESIKQETFANNNFYRGLDLSGLKKINKIGYRSFKNSNVTGKLTLPEAIRDISYEAFSGNSLTTIDFSKAINLYNTSDRSFANNPLKGDLDLSNLVSLTSMNSYVFIDTSFDGELTLPPNIEHIGREVFNGLGVSKTNKFKGTLKLPKSLKTIGIRAFSRNAFSKLDWSEAENLETIGDFAFSRMSQITLTEKWPPKIKEIGTFAFNALTLTENIKLPRSLITIGGNGFDAKNGINITISKDATGINQESFSDKGVIFKTYPEANEESYYNVVEETDPNDSNKQIKILRITKETTTEEQLKKAYDTMISKSVDVTTFNEIHLPYHLKGISEEKVKEVLHMNTFDNDKIGYILHKEDYDLAIASTIDSETKTIGGYKNQKLVELNLPEDITLLGFYSFRNNNIKKVNWSELTKLENIGVGVFENNKLTGNLDLSVLPSLKTIGIGSFLRNNINGTLKLPPNINEIKDSAFNSRGYQQNKIKGTLKLPKSLVTIEADAFIFNNIEILDWSEAESLETIGDYAFANNKIKTLEFNENTPPKIKEIGSATFDNNTGLNEKHQMFTENFILPKSLKKIGDGAIKIKNGITITIPSTDGITVTSFDGGDPILMNFDGKIIQPNPTT